MNSLAPTTLLWLFVVAATTSVTIPAQIRPELLAVEPLGGADGSIAPDGSWFVASSRRFGNLDLFGFAIASGEWRRLTDDAADDFEGRIGPDGTTLAYSRRLNGQTDIWLLDTKSLRKRPLVQTRNSDEYPSWSPDGQRLVFTTGPWESRHFATIAIQSGAVTPLPGDYGQAGACWWHSTEQLLCHSYFDRRSRVITIDLATGSGSRWNGEPSSEYKPASNPDGTLIAVTRQTETGSSVIVSHANGARAVKWTLPRSNGSIVHERWPVFSDANDLFFHRIVSSRVPRGPVEWGMIDSPPHSDPPWRRLEMLQRLVRKSVSENRLVVNVSHRSAFDTDVVIQREGREVALTDGPWLDDAPVLTADGGAVTFVSNRGGSWSLRPYQVALDTRTVTPIALPSSGAVSAVAAAEGGVWVWVENNGEYCARVWSTSISKASSLFCSPHPILLERSNAGQLEAVELREQHEYYRLALKGIGTKGADLALSSAIFVNEVDARLSASDTPQRQAHR